MRMTTHKDDEDYASKAVPLSNPRARIGIILLVLLVIGIALSAHINGGLHILTP